MTRHTWRSPCGSLGARARCDSFAHAQGSSRRALDGPRQGTRASPNWNARQTLSLDFAFCPTLPLLDNPESGKRSGCTPRLRPSVPRMPRDTPGTRGRCHTAFPCHMNSVRGGSFIVTGSSTNICDLLPQTFVSRESWEPLNFPRVFASQTKAINKSEAYNIPKGGWGKKSTLEVKIK